MALHKVPREEELVADVSEEATGALAGTFEIGASTGPGGVVLSPMHRSYLDTLAIGVSLRPRRSAICWVFRLIR